jgi:hypothetical protein
VLGDLVVDLGAEPDRFLPRGDLRLSPQRVAFALRFPAERVRFMLGVLQQESSLLARGS